MGSGFNKVEDVVRLAKFAIVGVSRASKLISERTGKTTPQAEAFARASLAKLRDEDFVERLVLQAIPPQKPQNADVYRFRDRAGDWYVKFFVENGRIIIVSFHEPEHQLITRVEAQARARRNS
ncbi:MAG: hypothetical protein HOO96_42335 [Polyangiaceae bacterium]|nr:hypothetical protein [Polyangiaceae bacterium]